MPSSAAAPQTELPQSASALRTLRLEIAGLRALESALAGEMAGPFAQACAAIADTRGRVIVTGMGKSGHVGAKIAATLASTGTPAFFIHPAEASHGDLGMIGADDAVMALSWSGETPELRSIVLYSRRFRLPLIAVTSRGDSTLARAADVALVMPRIEEACPHGLAPTTSSLVQLALGDALAIELLERRGFTADDFLKFHPGGSLGASLTRIRDIMHVGEAIPLAPVGARMDAALQLINEKRFGCVGIVDQDGLLAGIITDGDIRRHLAGGDILRRRVEDVMTPGPKTIAPDALAASALDLVNSAAITALMVVEAGRPVGIVHLHDLLKIGAA